VSTAAARAERSTEARPAAVWAVLAGLLLVVALAGVWAVRTHPAGAPAAASLGQRVAVPGGHLVVASVVDVDLSAPMSGPGMAMQGSAGVPDIPEGFRQVDVVVTLAAEASQPLPFDPGSFTVVGPGTPVSAAVAADDGAGLVPAGSVLSRLLRFQVPAGARELTLAAPGIEAPVALTLGPAPASHSH
jgi:hypothetical protein